MRDWVLKRLFGAPRVMPVPMHWLYRVFHLSDEKRRLWLGRVLNGVRKVENEGATG